MLSWTASRARAYGIDPSPSDHAHESRVPALLAQLTLDEKLSLLEGQSEPDAGDKQFMAGYLPGVARLGIPPLRLADGPPGVATRKPSTGMPCTMGVAATFSVDDAEKNGEVIGRDAKVAGQDVVLEPFVNLDRDTAWGRGFNTFGEDPRLTGVIAAAQITGIQRQGVMAQVKHFIAFEGGNNVVVDDQALHEVYLEPFALAVDAGVASIMCSYNVVNGAQACGSSALLTEVLRDELGFDGFVTSDWGANHGTTYLNAGLDLEMPGGGPAAGVAMPSYFAASALHQAIDTGSVRLARVDEAVARILRQYERFGLLDGPKPAPPPADRSANAAIVRRTAQHAATLLKNEAHALPLSKRALSSLVLIGPGAAQTIATNGGGEKPGGLVARQVGTVQALARELRGEGGAHIAFEAGVDLAGTPIPASALSHDGKPGLVRSDRKRGASTVDAALEFVAARHQALPAGSELTWTGTLTAADSGDYDLSIQALGATAKLIVDGRTLHTVGAGLTDAPRYGVTHPTDGNAPVPTADGLANGRARLNLRAGAHSLQVIETPDLSGAPVQVRLSWRTPAAQQQQLMAAVAAAARADTAVVFAWSGGDLSEPLPDAQDRLIAEVARANPNTLVVLNTSQPVAMPWLASVKAVLQMWFPGDEGGWATADVLLGRVAPSGHLPFTWPRALEQTVSHQPERSSRGVGGSGECSAFGEHTGHNCGLTRYSEGIHVGYRFFDRTGETPLFPFGFGLSYSSFAYTNLNTHDESDGSLTVQFRVRNTGAADADAVPQVYLGKPARPPHGVEFAARALAGFARVHVPHGATVPVTIRVPARQLEYWSATRGWTRAPGQRALIVGEHARDSALQTAIASP
jgi:beta-glucosidase